MHLPCFALCATAVVRGALRPAEFFPALQTALETKLQTELEETTLRPKLILARSRSCRLRVKAPPGSLRKRISGASPDNP